MVSTTDKVEVLELIHEYFGGVESPYEVMKRRLSTLAEPFVRTVKNLMNKLLIFGI